jgi:2-oxoglutarate dehydrogenase E2 component (dihydrolipoamide succinyltransferase)
MTAVRVPKINNNDPSYTLITWLVDDGTWVTSGDAIAEVETSKATQELVSPGDGVLRQTAAAGVSCEPGDVIGSVGSPGSVGSAGSAGLDAESDDISRSAAASPVAALRCGRPADTSASTNAVTITRPARELMEQLGVTEDRVRGLGLVRTGDVARVAAAARAGTARDGATQNGAAEDGYRASKGQRAVADTVSRSHREIPAAYAVMRVDVDAALQRAGALAATLRMPVGLAEMVVAAVAPLVSTHPIMFAAPTGSHTADLSIEAHIGVTIDAGHGLVIPVIRDASSRSVEDIVSTVDGFRRTAGGGFRADQLEGANITLSLHPDPEIMFAVPLVHPGQTCILAVAGVRPEVAVDADGGFVARRVTYLGLAYDHRFVNGRDATDFLHHIREALEAAADA